MKESMPSSAQPAQAAQKPRIWLRVSGGIGIRLAGSRLRNTEKEFTAEAPRRGENHGKSVGRYAIR